MNSLDAYKLNYQTIYHNFENAKICAINLMEIGKDYFKSTYKYKNLDKLEEISRQLINGMDPDRDLYLNFAFNHLIDAIKIGICFENYFKAKLLIQHFLVHTLDHNLFSLLNKEQRIRPVNITELLATANWEPYDKTLPEFSDVKTYWIKGITENTVSYSALLNSAPYVDYFSVDLLILSYLKQLNNDRNKLHLNVSNSIILFPDSYSKFKLLTDFVENNITNSINSLFEDLAIPQEQRKFQEIAKRVPIT